MGIVAIDITRDTLILTYITTGGWQLEETHLYVGTAAPRKSAPRCFPYKHEDLGGATGDTCIISLQDYDVGCNDTLYIASHAVVVNSDGGKDEETAWGEGELIGKNWAMYFTVAVPSEPPPNDE